MLYVSGLQFSVEVLDLSNTSLTILPSFHLPQLASLNMSSNKLTFVPSAALANMSALRTLDLSNNYLPSPPAMVWHIMPRQAATHFSKYITRIFKISS